jgi:hypothetical protein
LTEKKDKKKKKKSATLTMEALLDCMDEKIESDC